MFFINNPTSVKNNTEIISEFKLEQNYPNPFNPTTTIKYSIPTGVALNGTVANVQLIIYDILGRDVATLVNKEQLPGNYEVKFDASNLTSGLYFYKIFTGDFVDVKKLILLK